LTNVITAKKCNYCFGPPGNIVIENPELPQIPYLAAAPNYFSFNQLLPVLYSFRRIAFKLGSIVFLRLRSGKERSSRSPLNTENSEPVGQRSKRSPNVS
jgi:hypothetical protein